MKEKLHPPYGFEVIRMSRIDPSRQVSIDVARTGFPAFTEGRNINKMFENKTSNLPNLDLNRSKSRKFAQLFQNPEFSA